VPGLSVVQIIEVLVAAALIGAGVWRQVKTRRTSPNRGSQTAVILIAVGAIVGIHGLGLMEYRPSESEIARRAAQ